MNADRPTPAPNPEPEGQGQQGDGIAPLEGELGLPDVAAPRSTAISKKGLLAVVLLIGSLVAVSAVGIQRFSASARQAKADDGKKVGDRPASATAEPRRLELASLPASAAPPSTAIKVPAIAAEDGEVAEPIGVRRTGGGTQPSAGTRPPSPEDAPVLLVSSRPGSATPGAQASRNAAVSATEPSDTEGEPHDPLAATSKNLQSYQRQLQGLLDNLTRTTEATTGGMPAGTTALLSSQASPLGPAGATNGLLGGALPGSSTPKVAARMLGNRSLTLPKGTAFTCALKTRVISAASGLVACQVLRNVYGDDGRVLLIERGSHFDGEYRITSVRPGTVRIPVLWTRIRTPLGVVVDIDSPATGQLGESGIDGYVDNRWGERIGAAMLLSLIDDSVKLVIQSQSNDRQGDTIVLPSTTSNTSKLAEKVLDSTINIPPLVYQNQGGVVGIYVARDVDFSSVYELVPTAGSLSAR
ncbi:type IV secretion system protein VirB10 [Pelomonas cellulosilytica]|uniref:Type IV secretion system protein VirB10 n=1 Tax=Pelomonas cellulosilytica TaxID=2906762 RepID=A0ABS8Y486_9BURK|nr:type IV secretion system protein VirB10 [Pelomonas sp. P8]MCE4557998.1 type IV secretion system protein VirB10 [Pelomonas sp. P8]